jgi:hypothetical protein
MNDVTTVTCSGPPPSHADIPVRILLATIFSVCFAQLAKSLRYRYGAGVRIWFIILSLTGFHIPYYAGRTLPNFMALPGGMYSSSSSECEDHKLMDSVSSTGVDHPFWRIVCPCSNPTKEGQNGDNAVDVSGYECSIGTGGFLIAYDAWFGVLRDDRPRGCGVVGCIGRVWRIV